MLIGKRTCLSSQSKAKSLWINKKCVPVLRRRESARWCPTWIQIFLEGTAIKNASCFSQATKNISERFNQNLRKTKCPWKGKLAGRKVYQNDDSFQEGDSVILPGGIWSQPVQDDRKCTRAAAHPSHPLQASVHGELLPVLIACDHTAVSLGVRDPCWNL